VLVVVDDDPDFLKLATVELLDAFDTRTARSCAEARALCAGGTRPDAALVDVFMPAEDGLALVREWREKFPELPIVVISAAGVEIEERARAAGADDVVGKPIQRQQLRMRMRSLAGFKAMQAELAQGRTELVSRMRLQSEVLALLVHDFKGPLAAIQASAEFIAATGEGPQREAAEEIEFCARRISSLVRDILDLARSREGHLPLQREPADLAAMAREAAAGFRLFLKLSQVGAEIEAEGPVTARCDGRLIRRVIENLLLNAAGHSPPGASVRVRMRGGGAEEAVVEVADEGPGISDELRSSLFVKWSSGAPRGAGGHGLGLAFCRMAVEEHGGRLWVADNAPRGSVFAFALPA
jgi:signal transduction histidine kinase